MKNHDFFDFHEAELDEQLEQFEQNAYLAENQPALRTYSGLQALYAPASRREAQALARVSQRLVMRVASDTPVRQSVSGMLPITEQPTMPLRISRRRAHVWPRALVAVLVVVVLVGGFLGLINHYSLATQSINQIPPPSKAVAWHSVPTPVLTGKPENSLNAILVLSQQDAWAVGTSASKGSSNSQPTALILHWDGHTWKIAQAGSTAPLGGLNALAASGPDDIWAVGNMVAQQIGVARVANTSLIEHWDGHKWSVTVSPPLNGELLIGVTVLAPSNVWAVGSYFSRTSLARRALLEHWNGKQWSIVSTPTVGVSQMFSKITALSPTDIWAVGMFSYSAESENSHTLIEHWNGQTWQIVAGPSPANSSLNDISASSPTDIWAVGGFRSDFSNPARTLVEHWNGKQWAIISSPNPIVKVNNSLLAVAVLAPNNVWASGFETGQDLLHWDGRQWQIVRAASPAQAHGGPSFFGLASDPSTPGVAWAVGSYNSTTDQDTHMIIETNAP